MAGGVEKSEVRRRARHKRGKKERKMRERSEIRRERERRESESRNDSDARGPRGGAHGNAPLISIPHMLQRPRHRRAREVRDPLRHCSSPWNRRAKRITSVDVFATCAQSLSNISAPRRGFIEIISFSNFREMTRTVAELRGVFCVLECTDRAERRDGYGWNV